MNFDLTDEQLMLRDSLRKMLAEQSSIAIVRAMEKDPVGYPPALWRHLAEMGVLGLTLSDAQGGSGLGAVDLAVVFEELGRALCPAPVLETAVVGAGVLARAGSAAQQQDWLTRIAAGQAVLSPAFLEPGGSFGATGVRLAARADAEGYRLNGRKFFVGYANSADRLVTLVRSGPGETGLDLLLVDPKAPGVTLTPTASHALDPRFEVAFDDVRVPASERIGAAGTGWATWCDMRFDLMIALSAWYVGCAEHDLELTTAYAKERVQFGRVIGSFQAVAHQLADAATGINGARYLTWQAAWARDLGKPQQHRLAATAYLRAAEAARFATRTGHQIFGGIGFTNDIDVQLFFRRAKQHAAAWVDPRTLEEVVAADLIDA